MIKITVLRNSDNSLVAEDIGDSVTQSELKAKMLIKGVDIEDSNLYTIQIDNSFDRTKTREALKEKGRGPKAAVEAVRELISGIAYDMTEQQVTDLKTAHGDALSMLALTREPTLFKAYITAINTAVDPIITEEIKQNILDELADYGI